LHLSKVLNRKSNEHHMQAIILAGMIAHQPGMGVVQMMIEQIG